MKEKGMANLLKSGNRPKEYKALDEVFNTLDDELAALQDDNDRQNFWMGFITGMVLRCGAEQAMSALRQATSAMKTIRELEDQEVGRGGGGGEGGAG